MNRQEYNLKILDIIRAKAQEFPNMRFHQILWASGVSTEDDQFYEESEVTFEESEVTFNRLLKTLHK